MSMEKQAKDTLPAVSSELAGALRMEGGRPALAADVLDIEGLKAGGMGLAEIEFHREIDSTNRRAKELAMQGAPHGTLVLADSQIAGRGRFARRFHSPAGSGIYASLILRPKLPADRAVMLTAMAAVAVARAIGAVADIGAEIKWVNDVYIGNRKVCGILCEAGLNFENGGMDYVVMGIGVNVAPMDFPPELEGIATSVSNACGRSILRQDLLTAMLREIDALQPQLDGAEFMDEYRKRSNVIGREIDVLRGTERFHARALDINDAGNLIIQTPDGNVQALHSGEISIKFK